MSKNKPDCILTYDDILSGLQPGLPGTGRMIVHYWLPEEGRRRCETVEQREAALREAFDASAWETHEQFLVMLLTDELELVVVYPMYRALDGEISVDRRDVIRTACVLPGVRHVVTAHNHPDGSPYPSEADVASANGMVHALQICGLNLLDSVVMTRTKHYSLGENFLLRS